jgi:hypothetical protein
MVGMEDIVGGQGRRRRRNKEGPDFSNIHRDRHPGGALKPWMFMNTLQPLYCVLG